MKKRCKRLAILILLFCFLTPMAVSAAPADDVITLRVCSWEEYIDLGGWDAEEQIDLDNGVSILGVKPMYRDFEDWYYETYGKRVRVEYSCFGTNEDLYNQLTLGDVYDLVCPSEYMIMKLMAASKHIPITFSILRMKTTTMYAASLLISPKFSLPTN